MQFQPFAQAVAAQFALMSQHELFTTDIAGDDMYAAYLAAFPPGTDPIFRVATEHSCSTCKNFIRNIGNVVAIVGGQVHTVWDSALTANGIDPAYQSVALVLQEKVRGATLTGIYRTAERQYGAEASRELLEGGTVRTWNHFHGRIAAKHFTTSPGAAMGEFNNALGVFKRGMEELKLDAIDTVLDLIGSNALYRGDEHRQAVTQFRTLFLAYQAAPAETRNLFLMQNAMAPASRFKNTVIGTLVDDLSNGVELERAVKSFEQKVAPTNYKRPTALVTDGMKKQALATIKELGLEDNLTRRLAVPSDVSVNDVLWADSAARATMKGGIEALMDSIPTGAPAAPASVFEISIERFLADVLPKATAIDLVVRNRHLNNFMALTAPVHGAEGKLFKWDNDFAWTYSGNISDSIKDRVKAAGGTTDAVLRVSLAWHNADDLDLHAHEPGGDHICFHMHRAGRGGPSRCGGLLDVDMNAGGATNSKDPVENIVWTAPRDGVYKIVVNNYSQRDKSNGGYTIEVENAGQVHQFSCQQSPSSGANHNALQIVVKDRKVVKVEMMAGVTGGSFSQEKWGIATEQPARVSMITLSPNYWGDNGIGNKHYMFILDGCRTDEPLRGILNEYLSARLEPHRKVFEVLGDKTKCQPTPEQLAGLGFSSTKGDSVTVNVTTGARRDAYNIVF